MRDNPPRRLVPDYADPSLTPEVPRRDPEPNQWGVIAKTLYALVLGVVFLFIFLLVATWLVCGVG